MLRPRICLFEIHNLRTTAIRKVTRQFEVNTETRSSHDEADEPDDQRQTNRPSTVKNTRSCTKSVTIPHLQYERERTRRENTSSNHHVNIQKDNRKPTNIVSKRRVRFNWCTDSFLVRRFRSIAAFDTCVRKTAIVNERGLGVASLKV